MRIGIGHSAATHHSGDYLAMFAQFLALRVVIPSTPFDAKGLLQRALSCDDPVLFLEHRELLTKKGPVPAEPYEIEFGKAAVVRAGRDATVVALGLMAWHASGPFASNSRPREFRSSSLDPRTIAPLDIDTIARSVRKSGRLLIVDEIVGSCGIGAWKSPLESRIAASTIWMPHSTLNGVHVPTLHSPPLEAAVVPSPQQIERAIRDLFGRMNSV